MAIPCSNNHKLRLFVGEGNFSYTEAVIEKHKVQHPDLAKSIIATEFYTEEYYKNQGELIPVCDDEAEILDFQPSGEIDTLERIKRLKTLGVKVILGLDATKLQDCKDLPSRIPRIHWNLPLNEEPMKPFDQLLSQFFRSCREKQEVGDRVSITLLQGANKSPQASNGFLPDWMFQQAHKAKVVSASSYSGYKLIKKRKFQDGSSKRYPLYITRNSYSGKPLKETQITCIREFIFEKVTSSVAIEKNKSVGETWEKFKKFVQEATPKIEIQPCNYVADQEKRTSFYYECDSGNESSDYSDSEAQIEQVQKKLSKTKVSKEEE